MDVQELVRLVDLLAVGVFAVSGALAAAERRLDILGFLLFGTLTGIGGGTVRDLILNTEVVFWVGEPVYLLDCFVAAALTWLLARFFASIQGLLLWFDAVGLALFSVLGTSKALAVGAPPLVALAMGMITPTFGSLMRDTLLQQEPVLLGPEIYVTAALAGSASYLLALTLGLGSSAALACAVALAFGLRAAALLFGIRLPRYQR